MYQKFNEEQDEEVGKCGKWKTGEPEKIFEEKNERKLQPHTYILPVL